MLMKKLIIKSQYLIQVFIFLDFFFFFQAEDGIRDLTVTGVQTCALPILSDSAVLGWSKPDPRIFAHTLATLQALPQRAWMVGDNFVADIRGAAGLGLRTFLLRPSDRAPPGLTRVRTLRINRLSVVERVLE